MRVGSDVPVNWVDDVSTNRKRFQVDIGGPRSCPERRRNGVFVSHDPEKLMAARNA